MNESVEKNINGGRTEPFFSNLDVPIVENVKEPTLAVNGDSVILEDVTSIPDQIVDNDTEETLPTVNGASENADSLNYEENLKSDLDLITLHRLGSIKKEQKIVNLKKDIENLKIANRSKFLADTALDSETRKLEAQISWFKEGIKVHSNKIAEIEQGQDSSSANQESETVDHVSTENITNISESELEVSPVADREINLKETNDEFYDQIDTPRYTIDNNNVVNLDRSQWKQVAREENFDTTQVKPETSSDEIDEKQSDVEVGATEKNEEEVTEKSEYLRLKGEFRTSQQEYMETLKKDYKNRGVLKKMFGLGRKEMSEEVKTAYDKFMLANTDYYKFAQESGTYQKIAERINRGKSPEKQTTLGSAVMGRHVFRPAEERLKLQTSQMPRVLSEQKDKIISLVKKYPKASLAVGAALLVKSAVFSLPALAAGMGTRFAGKRVGDALEGGLSDNKKEIGYLFDDDHELVDGPEIGINLTELEKEIFSEANRLQKVRTGTKWAAVGAGLAAGGINSWAHAGVGTEAMPSPSQILEGDPNFSPTVESPVDIPPAPEASLDAPEIKFEGEFVAERGDNLSSAMVDSIRERVAAGELQLPNGVSQNGISHYIYQSFPEMTNATGVSPRLSPVEWQELGISSGNPQDIQVGESINMQGLIDKMWGQPQEFISPVPEVPSAEVAAENMQSIDTTPTPVEPIVPIEVAAAQSGMDTFPASEEGLVSESVESNEIAEAAAPQAEVLFSHNGEIDYSSAEETSPTIETSPKYVEVSTNKVEIFSREDILAERRGLAMFGIAEKFEGIHGYKPKMSVGVESLVVPLNPNVPIIHQVYEQMLDMYRGGEINLPAERANYVSNNSTALYSFIEETARELSDKKLSAFFGGSKSLDLSPEQWRELGFSSGNPQQIVAGDEIQMGKLTKIILEHAAEKINHKN